METAHQYSDAEAALSQSSKSVDIFVTYFSKFRRSLPTKDFKRRIISFVRFEIKIQFSRFLVQYKNYRFGIRKLIKINCY